MNVTVKIPVPDRLQAALSEIQRKIGHDKVRVGVLEGATYPDGTSLPMVAAVQEFGAAINDGTRTVVIPPRPFMRNTVANNSGQWPKLLGAALKVSDMDGHKALDIVGEKIVGQMQGEITALTDPPNAPATIAAKGSSKPLVDTGHLLRSIASEVVPG